MSDDDPIAVCESVDRADPNANSDAGLDIYLATKSDPICHFRPIARRVEPSLPMKWSNTPNRVPMRPAELLI